jgi:hypothetical protein
MVASMVMNIEESRSGMDVKCSTNVPEAARVRTIRVHIEGHENIMARVVYGFDQGSWEELVDLGS